jgi:methionyl-tRNA formyltransferase
MKFKDAKIVFFGSSRFSLPTLMALHQHSSNVVLVITQNDKPAGRSLKLKPTLIKESAIEFGYKVSEKIDLEYLARIKPDLGIVVSYGKILPSEVLDLFPNGLINLHPSLLPKYRGPSPLQSAILNGDQETGVTLIKLDDQMDHGPIVAQKPVNLEADETYISLEAKLGKISAELLVNSLNDYLEGRLKPVKQNESLATYCKLFSKADGQINWYKPAIEIERLIRALNPWPSSYTEINLKKTGKTRIKILEAGIMSIQTRLNSGEYIIKNNQFIIQCQENSLQIKKLQLDGKKEMTAEEFLRGYQNQIIPN